MELFDKRFVNFVWSDELQGKAGFFADNIDGLMIDVNNNENCTDIVSKSDFDHVPFHGNGCDWRFFYHDRNYECKCAYAEGKQIQYELDGEWVDLDNADNPNWESGYNFRIKPEEPKSRRMTHRELAEWLAKGYGQAKASGRCAITQIIYSNIDEIDNVEIPKEYKIRRWDSNEWIEPTFDVYNADCRKGNVK